jgi:transcriptional regulator with PAS, ATPase and Fis domain
LVDAGNLKFKPASLKERLDYGREFNRAKTMEEIEREAVEDALKRHNGDKKKAAEELEIGFSTLKRKCKEARIGCGNGG